MTAGPLHPALAGLVAEFRAEAERLAQWGAAGNAATLRRAADMLEAALRAQEQTPLTLQQAAAESGLSAEHIGRLVRQGKLKNVGRKHAPRVLRGDVARKGDHLPDAPASAMLGRSKAAIARAIVNSPEE